MYRGTHVVTAMCISYFLSPSPLAMQAKNGQLYSRQGQKGLRNSPPTTADSQKGPRYRNSNSQDDQKTYRNKLTHPPRVHIQSKPTCNGTLWSLVKRCRQVSALRSGEMEPPVVSYPPQMSLGFRV